MPSVFANQMIGHSSPGILQRYSKAIDECRRDAVHKLEEMLAEHVPWAACSCYFHQLMEPSRTFRISRMPRHQAAKKITTLLLQCEFFTGNQIPADTL
jgi:hypothetical protein